MSEQTDSSESAPRRWLRKHLGTKSSAAQPSVTNDTMTGDTESGGPTPRDQPTTSPDPASVPVSAPARSKRGIAGRSPFAIGFVGTLGAVIAIALSSLIFDLRTFLLLVIFSFFLALGLNPILERLTNRGVRRGLGVFIVAVVGIALVALVLWAIIPVVMDQANSLIATVPSLAARLLANPRIAELDQEYQVSQRVLEFVGSGEWAQQAFGGILGAGVAVANSIFSLVVTIVLTLYFLVSLPNIKQTIYQLAPASQRARARELADKMMNQIGGYLTGLFFVALCAGTCSFIFANLAGLSRFAVALACMVTLFAFIPLVGSTISLGIMTLVGFSLGIPQGIAALIYGLIYQQFDAYVIQPRVFQKSVNVPGVIVVIAVISGGLLNGILGAILAIPIAAVALLLYREVVVPRLNNS